MRGQAKSAEWQPKQKTCHRVRGAMRDQAKNGECQLKLKTSHRATKGQTTSGGCQTKSETSCRERGAKTEEQTQKRLRILHSSTLHTSDSSSFFFVAMMLSSTKLNIMSTCQRTSCSHLITGVVVVNVSHIHTYTCGSLGLSQSMPCMTLGLTGRYQFSTLLKFSK